MSRRNLWEAHNKIRFQFAQLLHLTKLQNLVKIFIKNVLPEATAALNVRSNT